MDQDFEQLIYAAYRMCYTIIKLLFVSKNLKINLFKKR